MREIQLTQGQVALVDDQDYDWLSSYNWHTRKNKLNKRDLYYAARWIRIDSKQVGLFMHNLIMGPAPVGMLVDHEDRDGLNNQRHNLRFLTHTDNRLNSERSDSSTHITRKGNKWRAKVRRNYVYIDLGSFAYYIDAQKAISNFLLYGGRP